MAAEYIFIPKIYKTLKKYMFIIAYLVTYFWLL